MHRECLARKLNLQWDCVVEHLAVRARGERQCYASLSVVRLGLE
jgi:hypothetical protein